MIATYFLLISTALLLVGVQLRAREKANPRLVKTCLLVGSLGVLASALCLIVLNL